MDHPCRAIAREVLEPADLARPDQRQNVDVAVAIDIGGAEIERVARGKERELVGDRHVRGGAPQGAEWTSRAEEQRAYPPHHKRRTREGQRQ